MSVKFARDQAEMLVKRLNIAAPPVDVSAIVRHLKLRIVKQELGEGVSGLLVSSPAGSCIVVSKKDYRPRQRFTIAHEVAHHFLRHQFQPGEHVHVDQGYRITQRSLKSSTGDDPKEVEANQFAASLLMPSAMIHAQVAGLGRTPLLDDDVINLSNRFDVSEQAMTIRLQTLGYL